MSEKARGDGRWAGQRVSLRSLQPKQNQCKERKLFLLFRPQKAFEASWARRRPGGEFFCCCFLRVFRRRTRNCVDSWLCGRTGARRLLRGCSTKPNDEGGEADRQHRLHPKKWCQAWQSFPSTPLAKRRPAGTLTIPMPYVCYVPISRHSRHCWLPLHSATLTCPEALKPYGANLRCRWKLFSVKFPQKSPLNWNCESVFLSRMEDWGQGTEHKSTRLPSCIQSIMCPPSAERNFDPYGGREVL